MSGPVASPGGWQIPPGRKPGWDWTPPGGATPRPDRMPRTVRVLRRTPFLDRDSVLHLVTIRPGHERGGMSLVRLSAAHRDDLEVITRYLLQDVAQR